MYETQACQSASLIGVAIQDAGGIGKTLHQYDMSEGFGKCQS